MKYPYNEKVGSKHGAPMGRHTGNSDLDVPLLHLRRVPLHDGYDGGGAYWGHRSDGTSLFCAWSPDRSAVEFFDAIGYRDAVEKLQEDIGFEVAEIRAVGDTWPPKIERLPVIFRMTKPETGSEQVEAFFPTLPAVRGVARLATVHGPEGHSSTDIGYYRRMTRAATRAEYLPLLNRLRDTFEDDNEGRTAAVRLEVTERWTRHHDAARHAAVAEES